MTQFDGWILLGAFPDAAPDDVGSWVLHYGGEAMLLEIPPGLTPKHVRKALRESASVLRYATASHDHEDHFDEDAWASLGRAFPEAEFIRPGSFAADRVVTDDLGNTLPNCGLEGCTIRDQLEFGKYYSLRSDAPLSDCIVIRTPLPGATTIKVKIPQSSVGGKGDLTFLIPRKGL